MVAKNIRVGQKVIGTANGWRYSQKVYRGVIKRVCDGRCIRYPGRGFDNENEDRTMFICIHRNDGIRGTGCDDLWVVMGRGLEHLEVDGVKNVNSSIVI